MAGLDAVPNKSSWRRLSTRSALLLSFVLLAAMAFAAFQLAPLAFDGADYANVSSIERDPSFQDKDLLAEAWRMPVALTYSKLPFEFQHNQSVCGPASVADVLHSLGDPRSQEQALTKSPYHPWFGYLIGGLTLDEEADLLSKQTGKPVTVLRDLSLDQFRDEMRGVNDPRRRYVVNFHRGPLFGRGHGHHSPLIAYLADRDMVLVGDVNAAFRPFLTPTERLWRATRTVDTATGRARGLVRLSLP